MEIRSRAPVNIRLVRSSFGRKDSDSIRHSIPRGGKVTINGDSWPGKSPLNMIDRKKPYGYLCNAIFEYEPTI